MSTQYRVTDGLNRELVVTLNNDLNWDFAPFRGDKLKVAQNVREFDDWVTWIKREFQHKIGHNLNVHAGPFKYLEIGSYAGESLFFLSQVFPRGSEITLVDLGENNVARKILLPTIEFIQQEYGHKITLLTGLSNDPGILEQVKAKGRFDMVFIDANHDFGWAMQDFLNYRDKAEWIAFHDISDFNIVKTVIKYGKEVANAAHVWTVLKNIYPKDQWVEFIDYDNDPDMSKMDLKPKGIGVLWSQW